MGWWALQRSTRRWMTIRLTAMRDEQLQAERRPQECTDAELLLQLMHVVRVVGKEGRAIGVVPAQEHVIPPRLAVLVRPVRAHVVVVPMSEAQGECNTQAIKNSALPARKPIQIQRETARARFGPTEPSSVSLSYPANPKYWMTPAVSTTQKSDIGRKTFHPRRINWS